MNCFRNRLFSAVGLLFLGGGIAKGDGPGLNIRVTGGDSVEVSVEGGVVDDGWVLQDSYDGGKWRDLVELTGAGFGEGFFRVPSAERYFRAVEKPLATRQEALTQARERWVAAGLANYQYRYNDNGGRFFTDDLILVEDGDLKETTSLLPPGFPVFGWGEQTVEDLFERLQRAVDGNAHMMFVRYHPTLGYPERAYVDVDERIADEEWGFSIVGVPEDPEGARERNAKLWSRRGAEAYEFDLRYETAWFGWEGRVRVEGGVVSVTEGGDPARGHILMTMEGYSAYVGAALEEGRVSSAVYDGALGYPVFFSRDWYLTMADGPGERFWISGFQRVGTKKAAP